VSVSVAGLVTLAAMTQPALAPEAKHTLLQYVTGKYLLPGNCKVNFEWEDPQIVGETMTFTVKVHVFITVSFFFMYFFLSSSFLCIYILHLLILIPWSKVLEKLTSHGMQRFITMVTRSHHWLYTDLSFTYHFLK